MHGALPRFSDPRGSNLVEGIDLSPPLLKSVSSATINYAFPAGALILILSWPPRFRSEPTTKCACGFLSSLGVGSTIGSCRWVRRGSRDRVSAVAVRRAGPPWRGGRGRDRPDKRRSS